MDFLKSLVVNLGVGFVDVVLVGGSVGREVFFIFTFGDLLIPESTDFTVTGVSDSFLAGVEFARIG